jgi:dolichyl-phosphate-mannose-protein mannosyltransferase
MTSERTRPFAIGVAGVLLVGGVLRLLEFSGGRPLWVDEAMLALGIGGRSAAGLLAPLPYDQTAPPLFLLAVKAVTAVGGMGEYSLRLVPLLAGLLLPWVVWRMARALAGPDAGLVAAALAAVSVLFIHHSGELKPYGLDAVVCAGLMLLAASVRAAPERPAAWWALASAGVLGLLLSTPAPFVQAGAIAALAADARVRKSPGAGKRIVLMAVAWGTCTALIYFLLNHSAATSQYMLSFWRGTFLDLSAADFPHRLQLALYAILAPLPESPEGIRLRWVALIGAIEILLLIRRSGIATAIQVGVPFVAVAVASAIGKYPIANRVLLFLAPCTFVIVAVLIVEVLRAARLRAPHAAGVGVLLVAVWGAPGVVRNVRTPMVFTEGRESARRILMAPADEPVYVLTAGVPAWAYYSTDWRHPDTTRLRFFEALSVASGPAVRNALVPQSAGFATSALEYRGSGRLELIGGRSGLAFRQPEIFDRPGPDPSWAGKEVDRIGATGRPYVWIYGAHWVGRNLPALRMELARRGMVVVEAMEEEGAVALRVRMPGQSVEPR